MNGDVPALSEQEIKDIAAQRAQQPRTTPTAPEMKALLAEWPGGM